MIKQGRLRLKSIVFVMLVVLVAPLFSACVGSTGNGSSTSSLTPINQLGTYSSPSWWNGQDCNKGNYSAAYSLLGYNQDGTPKTWRGIEVCGPTGNNPGPEEGFPGASQYMFQCTELVARYLLAANNLQSQIADGKDIVDVYTGLQNSPFHKVDNTDSTSSVYDGNIHMAPVEGDVLSYAPTPENASNGHTSIVTGSTVDSSGYGTITVIQQNIAFNGVAAPTDSLSVQGWVIQPSTNGAGSVISWMTMRNITDVLGSSTQVTTPVVTPIQRTITSQQTQSQTVSATGQGTTPGTQAKGMLRVRNPYSGTPKGVDMTYNAGTVFDDDPGNSPNVQMMFDATITVPGDGTSVTVPAHVVQIGTIGNISQIRGWTHYGAYEDPAPLDIDNSTPFTGGTDPQSNATVQQSDIDTAANSLKVSTRQSAVEDLNSQLQPNEHLVGDPQCTYNTTSDHASGDQTTNVTVTVQATCTATAST